MNGRFKEAALALSLLVVCAMATPLPNTGGESHETVYFLAGTPTNKGPETYPVVLYSADNTKHLSFLRTVVQKDAGLYWVLDDLSSTLAVAYPHVNPSAVGIIHEDSPSVNDVVEFNPKGLTTLDYGTSAATEGNISYALFVTLPNGPEGAGGPSLIKVRLNSFGSRARVTRR